MRVDVVVLALLVGGGVTACLGNRSPAVTPDGGGIDGGALRPLTEPIAVQAAYNDTSFFLAVRWAGGDLTPALAVALGSRERATAVRTFAAVGCFLGCHDASNDMPNWRPEDGERPMVLLPGFGGPAEVWRWQAEPGDPAGRTGSTALGTSGMNDDPDGGAGGLVAVGSAAGGTWTVAYSRPLAAVGTGVGLVAGALYDLGMALHPDGVERRHHYVSLPVALGLGEPSAALVAVPLPAGALPDFTDTVSFPLLAIDLFSPGITSFEFLVGAVVDRDGKLRTNDVRHGGAAAVATGAHACGDCHRIVSDAIVPPVENAGALERLVPWRGGVVGPPAVEATP